jgi:RNA polymerase subunit RPABC4/transcription elongation factor Spt4
MCSCWQDLSSSLVHAYFVIQQLYKLLSNIANRTTSCPQCNYTPLTLNAGRRRAKGYAPLVNNEEQEGCRDCKTVVEVAEQIEGPRNASKASNALDLV